MEYTITGVENLGILMTNIDKCLEDGFQKVDEAIETIESKINHAPATRKVRRAIRRNSQSIPAVPHGPPITTATEWRRMFYRGSCEKFGDCCEMKCWVCHHDY